MQHDLMQGLHINAYQFGTLAAFYYYAYTPMQIPVGMLYDRFGTRIVQFFACSIATLGVGLFISADSYFTAGAGRFLIGLGTAFAYIGVLKLASVWLPTNRFAMVAGLTTALGMVSAIFSDNYLTQFVQLVGYKNALHTAFVVGITLSFIILFFSRSRPKIQLSHHTNHTKITMNFKQLIYALKLIISNPQMWLIGLIGCLFYLPASVFLDLWGIPYLKTVYQLTSEQAEFSIRWVFIGWIISGPTIGIISERIKRRRTPLFISALMSSFLLSIMFYLPGIPLPVLYSILFFVGIFCGAHPLCFALGKENCPIEISGTAVAVTNTLIMLGGMVFQPMVGKLLDNHAINVVIQNGVPLYSASDYTYALSVIPLGLCISILLTCFLKETYCKTQTTLEETTFRARKLILEPEA
jgi:MFS family permease